MHWIDPLGTATLPEVAPKRRKKKDPTKPQETKPRYRLKSHTVSVVCETELPKRIIDSPDAAASLLRHCYQAFGADADREHFAVLCLSARGAAVAFKLVSTGTMTSCLVHPREVFGFAVREGAAHIVIAHNHPSGDPTPSPEDLQLTDRLVEAGRIMGIPVVDHIVLGSGHTFRSIPCGGSL